MMARRALFVCARETGRAWLAASLLQGLDSEQWEAWSAPFVDRQDMPILEQVLREQGLRPLSTERCILPTSAMTWEHIIILCSGTTDT
jgi:hypothetical protein